MINLDQFSEFFKNGIPDKNTMRDINTLINSRPIEEFCDLSATVMFNIIHKLFEEQCIIKIKNDISDEILNQVPFFRLFEEFVNIVKIDPKGMKLTDNGYMKQKVMEQLYNTKQIKLKYVELGYVKRFREEEMILFQEIKIVGLLSKLIKKETGRLVLTKKGKTLNKLDNRKELFGEVLRTYSMKYNWAYGDFYSPTPVGQMGMGFTLYLLNLFGLEERNSKYYAEKYLQAFPTLIDEFYSEKEPYAVIKEPLYQIKDCYKWRTIEKFLEWFGLIEIRRENVSTFSDEIYIKKSKVFDKIFEIDE